MTQRSLSQAVGFRSLAHLSDIEGGKRSPATATFAKFAKALGVTVADLENRDIRGVIEAAKSLFSRKPEMVGAFLKVIEAAKKMDAEELVARVLSKAAGPVVAAPPVPVPREVAPVRTRTDSSLPEEAEPSREVVAPVKPPSRVIREDGPSVPQPKEVAAPVKTAKPEQEKPKKSTDQPTLF
jgi:transcriptional regulator with XRE-family HTH domain